MKNVLMVLQGNKFPESAFRFVCQLNERSPVRLTGFILPEMVHIENWAAFSAASAGNLKNSSAEANTRIFKMKCEDNKINYIIRQGTTELDLPQVIKETRFADLLVASETAFYKDEGDTQWQALSQVMHHSECPVLVVPDNMRFPEQLMFAYDGSDSSMFAIRQFTYLFPELRSLDTVLVHMSKEGGDMPHKGQIEQWLKGYYPQCSFTTVNYDAAQYFSSEANPRPVLIVTGSFGRMTVSEWFHPSFAQDLIDKYHLLIFSGHKN